MKQLQMMNYKLRNFMIKHLRVNNGFSQRVFYAPLYTMAWFAKSHTLSDDLKFILLKEYQALDQNSNSFHFEFNHYAAIEYQHKTGHKRFQNELSELQFRNTQCTNWQLLKMVVELKSGKSPHSILNQAKLLLAKRQNKSGFIIDDTGVRSFQYHCFSMSLLAEIHQITADHEIKQKFMLAVNFITKFILPSGELFYIGRGQHQIFGIGPLLWSLLFAFDLTKNERFLQQFSLCFNYLKSMQYEDGRFPLVLTNPDEPMQSHYPLQDKNYWGWYGYNNLFDYLAFLGFYLDKIEKTISESCVTIPSDFNYQVFDYRDDDFQIIVQDQYLAILSRPGGAWSNDLPLPILFNQKTKKTATPCYGGEQYLPSLNRIEAMAYPIQGKKSIRKKGLGFLFRHTWIWVSFCGIFKRNFKFSADYFSIHDQYLTFRKVKENFLLFQDAQLINSHHIQTDDLEVFIPSPIQEGATEYSASGPLKSFWADTSFKQWVVKIR